MIQKTKTWEKINPKEKMSKIEFEHLFAHLPLDLMEKEKIGTEYWGMYLKFIEAEVPAETAWLATKNLFINKEKQIASRIKK